MRDAAPYAVAKGLPAAAGLLFTVVAVNLVSPEAYARATIAYAIAQGVALLSATWVAQAVLREAGTPTALRRVAPPRVLIGVVASAVGLGFVVAVFGLPGPRSLGHSFFFMLLVAAWPLSIVGQAGLQASQRGTTFALGEILRATLPLLILAFAWAGRGADEVWLLAAWATGALGASLHAHARQRGIRPLGRSVRVMASLRFGGPIALWAVLGVVLAFADRVIIAVVAGDRIAGQYAAAYDVLVRGASLAIAPLVLALHPRFMSAVNQGAYGDSLRVWRRFLRTSIAIAVVYVGVAILTVDLLHKFVLGGAELSIPTVALLALAGGLAQIALIAHKPDEAAGATFVMLGRLAVVSVMNVGANIVLVPIHGELAAAATTVASFAVYIGLTLAGGREDRLVRSRPL